MKAEREEEDDELEDADDERGRLQADSPGLGRSGAGFLRAAKAEPKNQGSMAGLRDSRGIPIGESCLPRMKL
jgi:hypothetical protein